MLQNSYDNSTIYESLFENSSSIMLIVNPKTGAILDANHAALKFYQYSKKEIVKLNLSDINTLSSEEINHLMENAGNRVQNQFQFCHRLKNNEIKYVEVYSGPITFDNQKALYSIVHDITRLRQAQKTLKESERTIRAMINATKSLVYLFDTDGVLIQINKPGAMLFDKHPKEMIGENFKIFFEENDYSRIKSMVDEVAKNHQPINYQKTLNERFYDVNLHPVFNKSKQVDRVCAFANDITDIKKTEKVFTAIETAGGICHEMNQPLQVIVGNLELLKMNIDPADPNMKFVENVILQAEKLGLITKKLTHITHYETKAYVQGTIFDIDRSSDIK